MAMPPKDFILENATLTLAGSDMVLIKLADNVGRFQTNAVEGNPCHEGRSEH